MHEIMMMEDRKYVEISDDETDNFLSDIIKFHDTVDNFLDETMKSNNNNVSHDPLSLSQNSIFKRRRDDDAKF